MSNVEPFEELFQELIELSTLELRTEFLDRVCGDDGALRNRLEGLLRSHEQAGSFLQEETQDETSRPGARVAGECIGPYRLRELIGEGGMGSVYVAEQDKPVKRKVALKVIKPGMDTKEVVARFEAERQSLAMMDHPSIAKVFDAGMTDNGRPYFVLELINGVPLTEFCDHNKLRIRQRLGLFVSVCKAVQHAHQRGVIHRDLKPSNVLVTLHDGEPVPVIIDFGVAKATNQSLTEHTIYTRLNQVVGTTLYMSPEQAELSRYGVDTRTDVYSLGVLLYELLTGTTPFDRQRLNTAAFDEVRRIIREEEPPKPSTRISGLDKTATDVSSHRGTDPGKLSHCIRGDLDWIVMKALEKDRNRRYESATRFADDVENYLNDQVVVARPPSTAYQLRKAWARNRVLLSTAGSVVIALAIGLGFAVLAYRGQTRLVAEKTKAMADLEATLHRLSDEVTGRALNFALMGAVESMEQALVDAEATGAEASLIAAIRGLGLLYSGNADAGLNELERATKVDPKSVAAWSGLWLATLQTGQYERMSHARLQIVDFRPVTDVEKLFMAQVSRHTHPGQTVAELTSLLQRHPDWGAAYSLRGRARINVAKDTFEDLGALERFETALDDFERAWILTGESEFVAVDHMLALLEACEYGRDAGLNDRCDSWMQQAESIFHSIGEAERNAGYRFKSRTVFLATQGRHQELENRWLEMGEDPNSHPASTTFYLFANDRMQDLDDHLQHQDETKPLMRLLRIVYLSGIPDGEQDAMRLYRDTFAPLDHTDDIRYLALSTFLLFGKHEAAKDEALRLLDDVSTGSGRWNRRCLKYLSDQSPKAEKEICESAGPFTREREFAYYSIGMVAWSNGEIPKALECFEKVIQNGFLDGWNYGMAYALRERIRGNGKAKPQQLMIVGDPKSDGKFFVPSCVFRSRSFLPIPAANSAGRTKVPFLFASFG